jgi:hypothetical protein
MCAQDVELRNVKVGGIYSNHCPLKELETTDSVSYDEATERRIAVVRIPAWYLGQPINI